MPFVSDATTIANLVLMPTLLTASACCSSIETALFSLTPTDKVRLRRASPTAAVAASTLLERPSRLLVLVLFLNNTINIAFLALSAIAAPDSQGDLGSVIFSLTGALLLILFGDILPKAVATTNRVWFARWLSSPLLWTQRVLGPICTFFDAGIVRPLVRLFGRGGEGDQRIISVGELSSLLDIGASQGLIHEDDQEILGEVLALGSLRVREVMTPRVDLAWLEAKATTADLVNLIRQTGHTKFPVCKGSLDGSILGLLNGKRFLASLAGGGTTKSIAESVSPVVYIPENSRLDQLLDRFRAERAHVALCVSETGHVTGMIEVEDVVKQIVPPIAESTDEAMLAVEKIATDRWLVPGRLSVRDWQQFFGKSGRRTRARRVATVGGLILAELGRIPRAGDAVELGNLRLEVESMQGRVIDRVLVSLLAQPGHTDQEGDR